MNFYFETIAVLLDQLLPTEKTVILAVGNQIHVSLLSFLLDYFHWWPSLLISLSHIVISYGGRALMYDEPITGAIVASCVVNMAM